MLLDPNTLSARRHRRPGRRRRSATTASCSPTAWPRPAPTGRSGRSATSRPARTATTTSSGSSSPAPRGRKDGKGFYYSRFPEPKPGEDLKGANYYQKLYYHKLGTPQADDALVYERPDQKEWEFDGDVTDDGQLPDHHRRARAPTTRTASSTRTSTRPTRRAGRADRQLRRRVHLHRQRRPVFWFKTEPRRPARPRHRDRHAQARRRSDWHEVIPQAAETLDSVDVVGDHFIAVVPEGRAHAGQGLRPGRQVRPRGRAARPRHRRRLRRQADGHGDVLLLHLVHHADDDLPLRRRRPARAPSSGSRRSTSTPTTTRRSRSSTRARTARACRCSSATRRA